MRKLSLLISSILLLTIVFTACSSNSSNTSNAPSDDANDRVRLVDAKIHYNPDVTFDELKDKVNIGSPVEEAIKLLGNQYDRYDSYYEDTEVTRYSFSNVENYHYQYKVIPGVSVADLDSKGLLDESLKYILFISSYNNEIINYAIAYKHQDEKVHVFYEFKNGETKEDIYS